MGTRNDAKVNDLLDSAEQAGTFALATDESTYRSMLLRCRKHAGNAPELVSPAPRIFARRELFDRLSPTVRERHLLRALALKNPTWVFCGPSAAVLYGLYVSNSRLDRVHILGRSRVRPQKGIVVHYHDPAPGTSTAETETSRVLGTTATTPLQTVADCMRMLPFPEALAIADSAARYYGIGRGALLAYLERRFCGLPGVRTALAAARHADARSENGGESIVRGMMIEAGFDTPELQVEIPDALGGATLRVDFLWRLPDGRAIIGEFDGREKLLDPARRSSREMARALRRERSREARLTVGHASVIRIGSDLLGKPRELERLLDAYGVPRTARAPRIACTERIPSCRDARAGAERTNHQVREAKNANRGF